MTRQIRTKRLRDFGLSVVLKKEATILKPRALIHVGKERRKRPGRREHTSARCK